MKLKPWRNIFHVILNNTSVITCNEIISVMDIVSYQQKRQMLQQQMCQ